MKQSLFIDLDKGTVEEAQKLTTLWKQFQPIVINNFSKEEEVRKQKENTVNYSQKYWDELMERNKKATEETYKNFIPKITVPLPQKDYEILSTIDSDGDIYKKLQDGFFAHIGKINKVSNSLCKINSIKRLSDNTTWTVGENTLHGVINKIELPTEEFKMAFRVGKSNYPLFINEAIKL